MPCDHADLVVEPIDIEHVHPTALSPGAQLVAQLAASCADAGGLRSALSFGLFVLAIAALSQLERKPTTKEVSP